MSKNLKSKITVSKVYGAIPTVVREVKDVDGTKKNVTVLEREIHVMRVYGQATGFRIASSQYGDSAVFKGSFKAINPDTGEETVAVECCLPTMVENMLSGALSTDNAEAVEFAFDIFVKPAKNAFGYEYAVSSILEVADAPVISALEVKMSNLALPGRIETPKAIGKGKGKGK
jgi:hypothetical protein